MFSATAVLTLLGCLTSEADAIRSAPGEAAAAEIVPQAQPPGQDSRSGLRGTLVLGPGAEGEVVLVASDGAVVSSIVLRSDQQVHLDLPIGEYRLRDQAGMPLGPVTVAPDTETRVTMPARMQRNPPPRPPPPPPQGRTGEGPEPMAAKVEATAAAEPTHKRWLSPLLSAVVPGVGQMVNREVGKGVGILLSSLALAGGTVAMQRWRDPSDGAGGADDDTQSSAFEVTRLAARGVFSGALALLYAAQIMDARQAATGEPVRPRRNHKVDLQIARMTTLGRRAGQPAYDLYNDWAVSVMGQPLPRFGVGVSDVSIKARPDSARTTFQVGARLTYRLFDRRRVWLVLGIGSFVQATVAAGRPVPLASDAPRPRRETDVGGTVYAQLNARVFMLDRWWIGAVPRFSVPLSTRYYSGQRSLPPFAPTFELGVAAGVVF